jgi:hypothetical protein
MMQIEIFDDPIDKVVLECPDNLTWVSATLDNFAQTFYAGVRIDLGHWTLNNVGTCFLWLSALLNLAMSGCGPDLRICDPDYSGLLGNNMTHNT